MSSNSWKVLGVVFIAPVIAIAIGLDFNRTLNEVRESKGANSDTEKELSQFRRIVLDSIFKSGYQIKSTDINGDNAPDLIAISTQMPEIYWYENPSWKKHLLYDQTHGNIDLAPKDVDGDGDMDLALACRFKLSDSKSGGHVYWLENFDHGITWKAHFIDSIPTSHRLRWADVVGDEREELINLPIIGIGAKNPDYSVGLDFCYYSIPESPAGEWSKTIFDQDLQMAHGLQLVHWQDTTEWSILTASFGGVHLFQAKKEGSDARWRKTLVGSGFRNPRPKQGASEVSYGSLGQNHMPFIATIEPWHGNQVVFYTPKEKQPLWKREVIDTTFRDGHALICADLNRDGFDEIIAGHRGSGYNLYIYFWDKSNRHWERQALDRGGMSAAGLCIFDFNADGYLDIAACGSATNNVVLYKNLGN